jgi:hypothetical protein
MLSNTILKNKLANISKRLNAVSSGHYNLDQKVRIRPDPGCMRIRIRIQSRQKVPDLTRSDFTILIFYPLLHANLVPQSV